jgi:hypothetical protein
VTRSRLAYGLALVASSAACSVDDIDHSGKSCNAKEPCPGDYACTNDTCCLPKFRAQDFAVVWKTPNALRLGWAPSGEKQSFVQYVLVLAKTSAELAEAEAQALRGEDDGPAGSIRTAADNPELGQYELRQSSGEDVVAATIADQLEPGTEYRVRLLAFDDAGCVSSSSVAVARTAQLSDFSFSLFDDGPHPSGVARPIDLANIVMDVALAFEGDAYVYWPGWPDDGSVADGAYENVGVTELNASLDIEFPALDFSTAYLEVALALEGPPLAAWGEARFVLGPEGGSCDPIQAFTVSAIAFRPGGEYSLLQVPLEHFQGLELGALETRQLCEVSFGRSFALTEAVRVDAIRLRW